MSKPRGETGRLLPDGEPESIDRWAGDVRICGLWKWPQPGFDGLRAQAEAEGHQMLGVLATEWAAGLAEHGYAGIWGAFREGDLVGLCGLTKCPYLGGGIGRVRRLYVSPSARRGGVGRALVEVVRAAALPRFHAVALRTLDPAVARWYEGLGFEAFTEREGVTHLWKIPRG